MVGAPVALHVAETMHEAFPDRFSVSKNLASFVAATWLEGDGLAVCDQLARRAVRSARTAFKAAERSWQTRLSVTPRMRPIWASVKPSR